MKHIVFPASLTELDAIIRFISDYAQAAGVSGETITKCTLAAEEAFANIANYAYAPGPGNVTVSINADKDFLIIRFTDQGRQYNPLSKEDPDISLTATDREPGGLGIYMIKQLMDEVSYEYRDSQNILTLRKAI